MRTMLIITALVFSTSTALAAGSPLDDLATASKGDAAKLVTLGDLYVEAMRLDDAKGAYNGALSLQPKYGEAEFGKARIMMAKKKFKQAKQECRGVARRHKTEAVGEICSGWFWLSEDRSARALDEFEKALNKGDRARALTGKAEALRRRADYPGAIAAYREALSAGAGYVAHVGLGLALEANGDRAGALQSLQAAVRAQNASCEAHFNYGRVLGSGAEAVTHLRTALAIRAGWTEANLALGDALLAGGDLAGAEAAYRTALAGEGSTGLANLGLGRVLHKQGKPADAKAALQKAIEAVPNLVDAYLLLCDIEYDSGDTSAAKEALEMAMSVAPIPRVYLHSGVIYHRMGRFTKARSFLVQALDKQPNLSLAHKLLGDIACERRLYDSGRSHYDQALGGDMVGVDAADIRSRKAACKSKHP